MFNSQDKNVNISANENQMPIKMGPNNLSPNKSEHVISNRIISIQSNSLHEKEIKTSIGKLEMLLTPTKNHDLRERRLSADLVEDFFRVDFNFTPDLNILRKNAKKSHGGSAKAEKRKSWAILRENLENSGNF
jgi:hypothetical protein